MLELKLYPESSFISIQLLQLQRKGLAFVSTHIKHPSVKPGSIIRVKYKNKCTHVPLHPPVDIRVSTRVGHVI